MKQIYFILLAISFSIVAQAQVPPSAAINFTATDVRGEEVNLYEILDSGKFVLIDFFFTTCVPCQKVTPLVVEAFNHFGCNAHDVVFLEIASKKSDSNLECMKWINKFGVKYPTISGNEGNGFQICKDYNITAYPTLMLIAPNHNIVIEDLSPIPNVQAIITALTNHGITPHECDQPSVCPKPSNLNANFSNVDEINLTWTAPNSKSICNVYKYDIFRNEKLVAINVNDTKYSDKQLAIGNYCYTVKSVCGHNTSDNSNIACDSVVPITSCSAPQNILAQDSANCIKLNWDNKTKSEEVFFDSFESNDLAGWKLIDADADGNNWEVSGIINDNGIFKPYEGNGMVVSYSSYGEPLTPDNWLITPKITIGNGQLNYFISGGVAGYPHEHYGVYVSTTGTEPSDFTLIFEETMTAKWDPAAWYQRNLNLNYNGDIYIAFRHFNVTNQSFLALDKLSVKTNQSPTNYSYMLYRNNNLVAENITNNNYIDKNLPVGEYCYNVKRKCEDNVISSSSSIACATVVGVNDIKDLYSLYPNPTNKIIHVVGKKNIKNIEIINTLGQSVRYIEVNNQMNIEINIENLLEGIYFLKIKTVEGTVLLKRFIVMKQ